MPDDKKDVVKKKPLNKKKAIREMRETARVNPDGSTSTHLLGWTGDPTKKRGDYGVFPRITPKAGKEFSNKFEDWRSQTPDEAREKNEFIQLKSKRRAEKLAAGAWKKGEERKKRQQGRVERLTEKRKAEAKKAGVDLDKPIDIGPLGTERKARIDKAMQEGVQEDLRAGLKKIQSVRQAPKVDVAEKPVIDLDIKDVRKERRAKIANIMSAFGQGLAGEAVDPFKYTRPLKEERLAQYEQYKSTSQAAKQRLDEWETGYIDEQLEYLKSKLKDPATTELQKIQLEKAIVGLEREEVNLGITKEKYKQLKAKKEEVPKEPTARLVSDIGEDLRTTRDISIAESKQLEKQNKLKEATSLIDIELSQAKLDLADMGEEGTRGIEFIDKRKRDNLVAKIQSLEIQRQEIIDGFEDVETTPSTPSTEDDIWKN
jgi:hypothetical protein